MCDESRLKALVRLLAEAERSGQVLLVQLVPAEVLARVTCPLCGNVCGMATEAERHVHRCRNPRCSRYREVAATWARV